MTSGTTGYWLLGMVFTSWGTDDSITRFPSLGFSLPEDISDTPSHFQYKTDRRPVDFRIHFSLSPRSTYRYWHPHLIGEYTRTMTETCGAESVTADATATTQSRVISIQAASALWTGPYLAAGLSAKMITLNRNRLRARVSTGETEGLPRTSLNRAFDTK